MSTSSSAAEYVSRERTAAAGRGPVSVTWSLGDSARDLDANVVRLAPDAYIAEHTETVLGVLVTVLAGSGEVRTPDATWALGPGVLAWLPAGTTRSVHAGPDGLTYTTAHRRRPGMSIGSARPADAGEAACLLDRVCPECGRLATDRDARFCARCGTSLAER